MIDVSLECLFNINVIAIIVRLSFLNSVIIVWDITQNLLYLFL
jgi:hypothetical protein